ncbi:urea transporter [Hymenobacter convexus]|uniref:urea transporter n=1 Tax=Hymenobacter sp. CA1UV-4 TaxID=3063782 RepID=UPI0027134F66|nr:urea transporter [Hymenobacter sp. CA1UV-4]MDO7854123.1 urea transporter [Hymenobacter sp. CA1UV-4]
MTSSTSSFSRAVLHSYAMLFFSQHRGFACVLLLVTFGHPAAGVAGLASAALAVAGARAAGFNREWTDSGAYSFNALLTGLALASFYPAGWALAGLVVVGAGVALLLSVALGGWLGGRGLPALSLPFVGTVWLLLLGGGPLLHLPAGEGGLYWLNEVYALGGPRLVAVAQWVGDWPWPPPLATYLRALGSVLFQDSAAAGLLVAGGLLWHSRIAFSLSGLAFLGAYGLSVLAGPAAGGLNEYNLGANYMVAAMAVGSVFVIPSPASYAWALGSVLVTVLLLAASAALLDRLGLPALSLPYCGTALLFLYVLLLRERPGAGLALTPVQRYSPERNLYAYATDRARLPAPGAVALTLPFLGAWTCTQGYADGGPTHLGDWAQALDFAILDADGHSYQGAGLSPSDFYAYNKPVLAPADGVVEEVIQHIEDNAVGEVNLAQNWGNTVVIRHAPGLFTQLSHLRAHSVPVKVGDFVRRGDIIGTCGNSGRSPEPHLHFQVQATPYVGSKTLAYPLAYFVAETGNAAPSSIAKAFVDSFEIQRGTVRKAAGTIQAIASTAHAVAATDTKSALPQLRHFGVPVVGETVRPPAFNRALSQALRFPPGYALAVRDADRPAAPAQRWEVFTDAYNLPYLRCHATGAVAYFGGDASVFYFTAFYGAEDSWLYRFYQAVYRVPLASLPGQVVHDAFPLSVVKNPALAWAQDVLAPFYRFVRPTFWLEEVPAGAAGRPGRALCLRSRVAVAWFGREQETQAAELLVEAGTLAALRVRRPGEELNLTFSLADA